MSVEIGDFRNFRCPRKATLVLTDPPYGLGKSYSNGDTRPFEDWVLDLRDWSGDIPWLVILGPTPTMRQWLPNVPEPDHMLWWHRTFLLPGRRVRFWSQSITPILVYRGEGAQWYGPGRPDRQWHDVIDAHTMMGDVGRLKRLGLKSQKRHPATTGTALPSKIIPGLTAPGDLVVDPMAGLGSILVAAQRLGRPVWGCEIDSDYGAVAQEWLNCEALLAG